jgi:RNA polymerase sigma-70 factor, ECF subfamily
MMEEAADVSLHSEPWEFFRHLYPPLFRYVARMTGAPESDVEDIVAESLLHAWRDRRSFRGNAEPVTWVLSIARNRVREFRRKEGLRRKSDQILRAIAKMDSEAVPDHLLQEAETKRMVRRTLEEIPPEYGRILVQRYVEGRTQREIAAASRESEEAIESRLCRARESFRDSMKRSQIHDEA